MADEIPGRLVTVASTSLHIVTFTDRRAQSNTVDFLFQSELERLLFGGHEPLGTTGACYRLLARAGVGDQSLPLRRTSVAQGLLSEQEYNALRGMLHPGVRAFTLVPIEAVQQAIHCFGQTPVSEALLAALGLPKPEGWADNTEAGEEEEGEGEEYEHGGDGGGDDQGDDGDDDESDGRSGASGGGSDASRSHHGEEHHSGEEHSDPQDDDAAGSHRGDDEVSRRRRTPPLPISDALEKQLRAFERFRISTINRERGGKAVASSTAKDDRRSVLHFFAWLKHVKDVKAPTFGLFSSDRMGAAVEEFIAEKAEACQHARIAKIVASLVSASRFTRAVRRAKAAVGEAVNQKPLDELISLHKQVLGEARQVSKRKWSNA